jgi:hypothetical protein
MQPPECTRLPQGFDRPRRGPRRERFRRNTIALIFCAANPENGTVTYTYNGNGTLASKRPAKDVKDLALIYTGVFETRDEWVVSHDSTGQGRISGLGHENGFPGQLVLIDVELPSTKPGILKKNSK